MTRIKRVDVKVKSETALYAFFERKEYKGDVYGTFRKGDFVWNEKMKRTFCGKRVRVYPTEEGTTDAMEMRYDFKTELRRDGIRQCFWFKKEWLAYYPGRRND